MLLAARAKDASMAQTAVLQIEAAFETLRDGGDAPFAGFYEAHLPEARRIRDALRGALMLRALSRLGEAAPARLVGPKRLMQPAGIGRRSRAREGSSRTSTMWSANMRRSRRPHPRHWQTPSAPA